MIVSDFLDFFLGIISLKRASLSNEEGVGRGFLFKVGGGGGGGVPQEEGIGFDGRAFTGLYKLCAQL